MKRSAFYTFFLFLIPFSVFGNHPIVRNFSREVYKSGSQNWDIVQSESNSMYFANNNGLLEFDGKNWTTFPIKNGTNVRSVLCTKDGRFYASTFSEFGFYQKNKVGRLIYHTLLDKINSKLITSNELYKILQGNKKIYFQTSRAVFQYDGDTIIRLPFMNHIDASGFVHNILFVTSSQSGIFMLNGNLFVRIQGSEQLINKKVCSILPYKDDKVLFVTSFNGVFLFDGTSLTQFKTGIDDFLKQNQVFCATTNSKQLVFGTVQRGIAVQDLENGNVTYVNTFSGLQNNTVLSAKFDNQQNLWLGLDNGIDYVLLNSPVYNMFGTNNLYGAGYCSVLKNNSLYFGTNQGLYTCRYPIKNNSSPLQLSLIKGMEGQIWCLNEIDHTLFCGDDQGAFILQGNRTQRIQGLLGTWSFKALEKHPGMILGCSYQGLFILKKINGQWKLSHFLKGKFNESSPMFEEDNDGNIWFSHWQKGLFHLFIDQNVENITNIDVYDQKSGFPSNRNNTIFKIGNDIVFSSERGFYTFNKKTNKMDPSDNWNKLFNNLPSYMRLHQSTNGDVWCISGKFVGLARKKGATYSMDSISYRILQSKIITGFEHFNFIDKTNLIVSTEDGFSWVDSKRELPTNSSFNVFVKSIEPSTDKQNYSVVNSDNKPFVPEFNHNQNSLRIQFVAPEFKKEGIVQYSYMLENYDDSWSEFSADNMKEYTQLPKGHYVFKVRARDIFQSKEAVCSYSFTILPAWYESNVATVIYFLLFAGCIIGLIYYINLKSKMGAVEMEKIKEIELTEQKKQYEAETSEKKREIKELKNQQLQYELRHKSQELASSTMNLIRKNEMLLDIVDNISKVTTELKSHTDATVIITRLSRLERNIKQNIENDNNWKRFEENFDLVYENYLKRLGELYPNLNTSDKRLCAYLKMDLSSKDIAPLLNMSVRSIEMSRYRLRKKMGLDRDTNLSEFLQRM